MQHVSLGNLFLTTSFGGFLMYFIQQYLICRPSESTVTKEAGIEPRTFRSQSDILTTWLDLIHTRKIFARIKIWKRRIRVEDEQWGGGNCFLYFLVSSAQKMQLFEYEYFSPRCIIINCVTNNAPFFLLSHRHLKICEIFPYKTTKICYIFLLKFPCFLTIFILSFSR